MLFVITAKNWKTRQYDIVTTYFNNKKYRMLYTRIPKGFDPKNVTVCLLNKDFYGLIQSAYLWFEALKSTLLFQDSIQN